MNFYGKKLILIKDCEYLSKFINETMIFFRFMIEIEGAKFYTKSNWRYVKLNEDIALVLEKESEMNKQAILDELESEIRLMGEGKELEEVKAEVKAEVKRIQHKTECAKWFVEKIMDKSSNLNK